MGKNRKKNTLKNHVTNFRLLLGTTGKLFFPSNPTYWKSLQCRNLGKRYSLFRVLMNTGWQVKLDN